MLITDLPRDPNTHLAELRAPLVKTVNAARHSEAKARLLETTLTVALAEVRNFLTEDETQPEEPTETQKEPEKIPAKRKGPVKRATAKVKKDDTE